MLAREGGTQFAGDLVLVETFDRGHLGAFARKRVSDAGARRYPVDQDRTRTADAMLAAEMGAGEIEPFAQEIGEMRPWLDGSADRLAVHDERDFAHCRAWATARRKVTTWICRSIGSPIPALSRMRSAICASKAPGAEMSGPPPNSSRASASTIGRDSVAPITARRMLRSGSTSTAPIACANS